MKEDIPTVVHRYLMALRQTHDYQSYFDPKAYLAQRFSTKNGEIEDKGYQAVHPFFMECHHGFYSKYHPNWHNETARVLEYGGGPVVYYLSCAVPYVREIVFAEYLESCRSEVQLWREKDPASHDWVPYFRSAIYPLQADNNTSHKKGSFYVKNLFELQGSK